MKIRIITDSASEMVSGEHLTVLPLTITFGTTEYAEAESPFPTKNFTKSSSKATSCPPPVK